MLDDKGIVAGQLDLAGRRRRQPRAKPLVAPDDAKGMKVRGGSREMDMMLKAAGASVISLPSNEIYAAMQTGAMDAAMTSSTSFISFKLEEIAKDLTTGRDKAYWFMFEPLLMSKDGVRQACRRSSRTSIMAVGAEHGEVRASTRPRPTTSASPTIYAKAGAKVFDLDEATRRASGRRSRATPPGRTMPSSNASCARSC